MTNIKGTAAKLTIATLSVAGLALYSTSAAAVTQSLTATISFDTAISFSGVTNINFGVVTAANASTYKITTAGAVTTTAGTGVWLGGTTAAGSITIKGSATATISITANNYGVVGGVTPSAATCSYNGGAEVACTTLTGQAAPGAAGKVLLVGVSAASDGTKGAGTSAVPTFDIVVTYT